MKKLTSLAIVIVLMLSILPTAQASEYMNVYSLDGRVEVISTSDFDAWHAVGWYSAPVMYVYAPDGRCEIIKISDFDAWHKVGWYSAPVMTVYAGERSTIIAKEEFRNWHNVGWDGYVPITLPSGKTVSVLTNDVGKYVNKDPAVYYNSKCYNSLNVIQWSPFGTYITVEQARMIAKKYVDENYVYCKNGLSEYMKHWEGVLSGYEEQIPELADYSDTSYLIGVYALDTVFAISVNKTTGYAFYCGGSSLAGWPIGIVF